MSRAVLSLGSNLGDRAGLLAAAVRTLGPVVWAVSSVYSTPPWGPVAQDDFYNLVLIAEDEHVDALGWLERCHGLESDAGRVRVVRWGPRTLDADVISVTEIQGLGRAEPLVSSDPVLTLPHPRARERAFVLLPWAEVDPGAELAGYGPIADLLARLDVSGIHRVGHVHG